MKRKHKKLLMFARVYPWGVNAEVYEVPGYPVIFRRMLDHTEPHGYLFDMHLDKEEYGVELADDITELLEAVDRVRDDGRDNS